MKTRYSNLCFISSINVNQTLITIQVTNLNFHKPVNLPMYNPFKSSFINRNIHIYSLFILFKLYKQPDKQEIQSHKVLTCTSYISAKMYRVLFYAWRNDKISLPRYLSLVVSLSCLQVSKRGDINLHRDRIQLLGNYGSRDFLYKPLIIYVKYKAISGRVWLKKGKIRNKKKRRK